MSERTFFTLRYALPGYTFILMIVLVAYPELQKVFSIEDATLFAAFLAFFALLGGGALGFLVSQVWYVIYNRFVRVSYGTLPETIESLEKKYGPIVKDKYHQTIFLDYVHRLSSEGIRNLTQRRFDLMHLCGSTLFSALIGSLFGVLIRTCLFKIDLATILMTIGFPLLTFVFLIEISFPSILKLDMRERGILWFLILAIPTILLLALPGIIVFDRGVFPIVVLLVVLLFLSLRHAQKEHAMLTEVSVKEVLESKMREHEFQPEEARKVFPDHYFRKENGTDACTRVKN